MPGLHAELPGRPECTGRLERLASQVLRTDRSEFRKERHTGCRTECWWLPGLGSERHTGLRWTLPESAQALQVPERLPYTDQRLASEQPLRTGRRPVPECRSGRIVRLRSVASFLMTGTVDTPVSSPLEVSSLIESALETIWLTTSSS